MNPLKTDYKNDELKPSMNGKRHYAIKDSDGVTTLYNDVILEDVSEYNVHGDEFGKDDINAMNKMANKNYADNQIILPQVDGLDQKVESVLTSAESARLSEQNAVNAMQLAEQYKNEAMTTTPEGYEQLVETVDSQNVHFATDKELQLETKKGGIRLQKIEGATHKSKNLLDVSSYSESGKYLTSDGSTGSLSNFSISKKISVKASTRYTYSAKTTDGLGTTACIGEYTSSGSWVKGTQLGSNSSVSFTTDSTTAYIKISIKTTLSDFMLNEGETALQYEPYGLHVAGDMGYVNLADLTWSMESTPKRFNAEIPSIKNFGSNRTTNFIISDIYKPSTGAENKTAFQYETRLYLYDSDLSSVADLKTKVKDVKLAYELADGATPSQYAEVVKQRSKNLFNENNAVIGKAWDNVSSAKRARYALNSADYTGQTLSVSCVDNSQISFIRFVYGNGSTKNKSIDVTNQTNLCVEIETTESTMTSDIIKNAKIQLEIGNATDYVPYSAKTVFVPLSQPLAKVEDIANYINKDGYHCFIVKRIFNGSENWLESGSIKKRYYLPLNNGYADADRIAGICNHATIIKETATVAGTGYINQSINICTNFATVDDWKAYLASNPLILYYPIKNPTLTPLTAEQKIALNSLESYEGQTHIETADKLATLSVGYGKSDTVATALGADNQSKANEVKIDETETNLNSKITKVDSKLSYIDITVTALNELVYSNVPENMRGDNHMLILGANMITNNRAWVLNPTNYQTYLHSNGISLVFKLVSGSVPMNVRIAVMAI